VGGNNNSGFLATVDAYDPAANAWKPVTSMPTPRYQLTTSVVNGVLYAVGGYNLSSGWLPTVEAYTPADITWSSSDANVAAIDLNGLASAIRTGMTTITATANAISGNATLTVLPPTLNSIAVSPAPLTVNEGQTQSFTAVGTFSDGSSKILTT